MSPDDLLKALGNTIRQKRAELGYSQEGFAEAVGLHRTYIGAIERGERNVSFINLVKIALALDEAPSQLLSNAESLL